MEQVASTRTARIERTPEGIVVTRILAAVKQTFRDAEENVAASHQAGRGRKPPLLVDLREALPLDAETRHYYTGKRLTDFFPALGILSQATPFGRMMANVYIRVAKPGIPTQLFGNEGEALTWLKRYVK